MNLILIQAIINTMDKNNQCSISSSLEIKTVNLQFPTLFMINSRILHQVQYLLSIKIIEIEEN